MIEFVQTMNFRFVKRREGKEVRRVLQQMWTFTANEHTCFEWRDIPVEDNE